jgi:hypothetical protein
MKDCCVGVDIIFFEKDYIACNKLDSGSDMDFLTPTSDNTRVG